ncbi:Uridylate kinase [archaeon HR06]|nr:Uridylate kinase [archaeon HR06]
MKVVIKLSGSLFKLDDLERIKKFKDIFEDFFKRGNQLVLVTGGGEIARKYIEFCRSFGVNEGILDEIGILIAKINAKLLSSILQDIAYQSIPKNLEEVSLALNSKRIVCCGGFHPGHSTNAVAALIAEYIKADLFLNATDVDGIYNKDPKRFKDAKKLNTINIKELIELLYKEDMLAGSYELLDLLSLKILERSKLKTRVILCDPQEVKKALEGKEVGTLITF